MNVKKKRGQGTGGRAQVVSSRRQPPARRAPRPAPCPLRIYIFVQLSDSYFFHVPFISISKRCVIVLPLPLNVSRPVIPVMPELCVGPVKTISSPSQPDDSCVWYMPVLSTHPQESSGGMWLYTDYKETKTAKTPHPMKGIGLWSYDTEAKKFVGGWVDNTGIYQTQESSCWEGDEIVFTGPTHNSGMTGMTGRDTFKGKGKTITHLFEIEMKGTWKKYESDSCTKM